MAEEDSRYANVARYLVRDRRGREVTVLEPAGAPEQSALGVHRRNDGERLDHLAGRYLGDATAFWRIAELADVMLPEALSEADEIEIPGPRRR